MEKHRIILTCSAQRLKHLPIPRRVALQDYIIHVLIPTSRRRKARHHDGRRPLRAVHVRTAQHLDAVDAAQRRLDLVAAPKVVDAGQPELRAKARAGRLGDEVERSRAEDGARLDVAGGEGADVAGVEGAGEGDEGGAAEGGGEQVGGYGLVDGGVGEGCEELGVRAGGSHGEGGVKDSQYRSLVLCIDFNNLLRVQDAVLYLPRHESTWGALADRLVEVGNK